MQPPSPASDSDSLWYWENIDGLSFTDDLPPPPVPFITKPTIITAISVIVLASLASRLLFISYRLRVSDTTQRNPNPNVTDRQIATTTNTTSPPPTSPLPPSSPPSSSKIIRSHAHGDTPLSPQDTKYLSAISHRTSLLESTGLSRRESLLMAHTTLLPTLPQEDASLLPPPSPPPLLLYCIATATSLLVTYHAELPTSPHSFTLSNALSFLSRHFCACAPPTDTTESGTNPILSILSMMSAPILPAVLGLSQCHLTCLLNTTISLLFLSLLHYLILPFHLPPLTHTVLNTSALLLTLSRTPACEVVLCHAALTTAGAVAAGIRSKKGAGVAGGVAAAAVWVWEERILQYKL